MILVDSSVWIDWLGIRSSIQTDSLERFLVEEQVVGMGDLMLTEVLQGSRDERAFDKMLARLSLFYPVMVVDRQVSIMAARNYRVLRSKGITVRKTIDTLIATRCILDGIPLLYSDRDFDPFVEHLGLISALDTASGVT